MSAHSSDASRRVTFVILNAASGTGKAEAARDVLGPLFVEAGRAVEIVLAKSGDELSQAVDAAIAAGPAAIVAGGGDGTVSSVAAKIAGTDISLGVLPLGTLNHFAKDLGLPLGLEQAARVILAGRTTAVDVGEVNGRVFLNNSSLGLYPRIVRLRERYRARGPAKWAIAAWATLKVLEQNPSFTVRIEVKGQPVVRRTALLLVGNNAYRMAGLAAGERESLSDGQLAIYVVKDEGVRRLLRLAWQVVTGKAKHAEELDVLRVTEATIEASAARLPVAFDGEVDTFDLPLHYIIRPGALRVFVTGADSSATSR